MPSLQSRITDWVVHCFGPVVAKDKRERGHRFLEEALELVQAGGCTASEAYQLVDYVFGRPVGQVPQEAAQVMGTLVALCSAYDVDVMAESEFELSRCWANTAKIRAKWENKPKFSPLPGNAGQS